MTRASAAFVWDIKNACDAIADFLSGVDFSRYESSMLLRSGVERQLQNFGEALSQLSKQDAQLAARVPKYRQLIGFRNVLVHGYSGLNHAEIWRVIEKELPALTQAANALALEVGPA
jgi:uncharacterized protein with HEPN domain